jgi:hypothetical protein
VRRFPLHTLLLMLVALLAFARLYYVSHRAPPAPPPAPSTVAPLDLGRAACRSLDAVLADVLAPDAGLAGADPAWGAARRQLQDCPTPPASVCARGPALAALAPGFGPEAPPRGMLATLCERCAPADNPCHMAVTRALGQATRRQPFDVLEAKWSLEHAGPSLGAACRELARLAVGPAAVSGPDVEPPLLSLLEPLVPACVKTGQLPLPLLHAAVVQQHARVPQLAALTAVEPVEAKPLGPDQTAGPGDAFRAFDRDELSGVKLPVGTGADGSEGALRLGYAPTLKQVVSFQVRATGPGSLRARVRAPEGVGRQEGSGFFVDPTVCRFQGTGRWESCKPAVPLLDVEALHVLPARPGVELQELEVEGAR